MNELHALTERQLILVTGKGGVGKSALTATLGRCLAARGRRTLIFEVDPRENLHQLLDVAPSGGEIVEVTPNLYLQNLKPRDVVDWVVEKQVKIGMVVKRVLKSPIYHRFADGAPGLTEMAILGHALRVVRGELKRAPKIDTVILDAPATGHGIYLLTAPQLFAETVQQGPFEELASDAARFIANPENCGLVVVTLAEEMPVQEALELRQDLFDKFGRGPDLLVANGLYPPLPEASGPESEDDPLLRLWRQRRGVNEREMQRLTREWDGPRVDLPLLSIDRGADLVNALEAEVDAVWDGVEADS